MDARNGLKQIAAILFVLMVFYSPLFVDSICTYEGGSGSTAKAAVVFDSFFTTCKIERFIILSQTKVFSSRFFLRAFQVIEI